MLPQGTKEHQLKLIGDPKSANEQVPTTKRIVEEKNDFIRHKFLRKLTLKLHISIIPYPERREIHKVQVFDFGGLPYLITEGLSTRMLMEQKDAQGQSMFTSRAWRFGEAVLNLDTPGALQFQLGGIRRSMIWREFILALGLHSAEEMISSARDFLGTAPSYTFIRDYMLRLCHRLIACSIAGRSQAPEKVTVTDLFYLRGMDVGLVNVSYLLARYLRLFASGRKHGSMIFGGQCVARLAEHIGLLTEERLQGLTVPAGPARQEGGARRVAKEALVAPGGGDEDEEMPQAVPPPPRTQGKRIARLEEEVQDMREVLQGQREVLDSMARDFSRFSTWIVTSLARLMDKAGVPYTRYS
ncbi:hypothetical protein Tco_0415456 [Tanacetum coccineum]